MRMSHRIRRRLPARSSGPVRSLPFVETILTRILSTSSSRSAGRSPIG